MQSDADPRPEPAPATAAIPMPEPVTMGAPLAPPPLVFPLPNPPAVPSFMVPSEAALGPPVGAAPTALTAPVTLPAGAAPRVRASTAFLVVVTVVSLVADLTTKAWAKDRLSAFDPRAHGLRKVEVLKGHIDFIFAQNPGGAWSFLRSLPDSLRRPFFLVVSAAAIVFIVSIYQRVHRDQLAMKWGLPLALGGAMGNLVDRIRYGWVVDFIDFSMKWGGRDHHWPTFNVADIAIVVGVALMAIDMLRTRGLHAHEEHAAVPFLDGAAR
jgi:signal peptidase II